MEYLTETYDEQLYKLTQRRKYTHRLFLRFVCDTVKPAYNDHLMGYFSAFWSWSASEQKVE